METKEYRTLDEVMENINHSIIEIKKWLGFCNLPENKNSVFNNYTEVNIAMQHVFDFINSPKTKRYFAQFIEYALFFESALAKLTDVVKAAERQYSRSSVQANIPLSEAKGILETLSVYITVSHQN
jgi:hypothetical protein